METVKWRIQPNNNVKFHVPVPLLVTHYLCPIYPSKSNDCHSNFLIFTITLANNIFVCTLLKCNASLQCVGWTEEKSPKVIVQELMHLNKHKLKHDYLCDISFLCSLWLLATTLRCVALETSRPASTFLEQQLLGDRKWGKWIMSHHIL